MGWQGLAPFDEQSLKRISPEVIRSFRPHRPADTDRAPSG